MFSCEFCEISHNILLKSASDSCFMINTRYVYCPTLTFCLFLCHTNFLAEYFFGLICGVVTRVSSIFQALSLKSIFNPVEHLRLNFFDKNSLQLKTVKVYEPRYIVYLATSGRKRETTK